MAKRLAVSGWGLVLGLALSAGAPAAAAAQTGCLGEPLDVCLAVLRSGLAVDENFIAASLNWRHRVDVNGRAVAPGLMSVSAKLPGRLEPLMILLHLADDDRVTGAETTLADDPRLARTEAEYDRTGLYPLAVRLLGPRCPEMTPLALYQFFENRVKPAIRQTQDDVHGSLLGGHRLTFGSAKMPFCGAAFSYGAQLQWSGPREIEFGRNVTAIYTIRFE